jgi:hypothetical protein
MKRYFYKSYRRCWKIKTFGPALLTRCSTIFMESKSIYTIGPSTHTIEEFHAALAHLEELASSRQTAIMCAEAVPWRCHRSLIADALTVNGWQVFHIMSKKTARQHPLTSFLRVQDSMLSYPGEA